jgi:hypothetical protein
MKIQSLKCWSVLFAVALLLGLVQECPASGGNQPACGLNFTGPAGNLLTSFVDVYPNFPNCDATFNSIVQTTNAPLPQGTYLAWCIDANVELDPSDGYTVAGTIYTGELLATCDTNLNNELPPNHTPTTYVSPAVWQQVNYLLNHKVGTNFWNIQVAINDLVGGPTASGPGYPTFVPSAVQSMLTDASNNAAAWSPQPGNVIGAVYYIQQQGGIILTNPVQLIMLEVPYCPISFTKCPANVALGCNPTNIPDINLASVSAISSCNYPVTITCTKSQATAGCATYRYLVYTASDAYGNSACCSQMISWTTDTTAPVLINAPTNATLGYNPVALPTDLTISNLVAFSETCSSPKISVSHVDSGTPCAATRTFYISAVDACGNKSVTNYVVYNYAIDTNAPVITSVPPSTNLGCSYTTLPTDATVTSIITATDNCTLASTNVTHVDSTNGFIVTRTFSITVTDAAGNTSATSTVVYTWSIATGPNISCAADITIVGTNASPGITGIPSIYDACGNPITCSNSVSLITNCYNLYCDQFSGSACTLNNRAPDGADMGGLKWTACNNWITCGAQAVVTNCNANAFLPFQPAPGCLYQVSADIECVGGSKTTPTSDWVGLGFANGFTTGSAWYSANSPVGWQLCRNSGNTSYSGQVFVGTGTTGCTNIAYYPTNITHYAVMLDTRPANPAAWTFTYLVNGKVVTPTSCFGGAGPTITSVGFGLYSTGCAAGHVKNFCVCLCTTSLVTNGAACANLNYTDSVVPGTCAGSVHLVRKWYAWDNQGHTNTCLQNIYETIPLPPVCFAATSTNLGCAPATLPTDASVAALVIAYTGLSSTNVTHVDATNNCSVTRTLTVTVKDSCGNTSPAATLVYNWVNAVPAVRCWVNGLTNSLCLSACSYTCWVTNTGNAPFASCSVTACGQTFSCPALNPGQGCSFPINYTFQTKDLGLFNCFATATATCATACAPTCSGYGSCTTTVCGSPSCKVVCSGPTNGLCNSSGTYLCCVTNTGTCPFSSCLLNACGQSFNCPSLNPGQGCCIPVNYTWQIGDCGAFSCNAVAACVCTNSTAPTCSAQSACGTSVVGVPKCNVTVSGPSTCSWTVPATYTCSVVNCGTAPISACTLTACGKNFSCPALKPGQSCSVTCTQSFNWANLFSGFTCQAVANCTCAQSTTPTCSAQGSCFTSLH